MKGKIIVTGGSGFIGSHTSVQLIEEGYEVVIMDDLSNSKQETIDRITEITGLQPIFLKVDLKNPSKTTEAFQAHRDAIAVIHFAASKAVGESVQEPLKYYQNNIYALLNTLITQKEFGINHFIFSSSATVYGTPTQLPITEIHETQRPFSPYGNSKKMGEEIIADLTNSDKNFSAISLRYFNPIGAHSSGMLGELPNGVPNNLMPYITQTAIGIREKLMVYGSDYPTKDGTPIRDYIHVVDLAKAHVKALQRLLEKKHEKQFEYFNLGTGRGYSVLDVIKTFERVTKTKLNYEITGRREGDVPQLYTSTALAKEKLDWEVQENLESMIQSSWNWELNIKKNS
jgi:UDP-glucose 4-epimerase